MGQNHLKVSVVIPVYNEEKYLSASLDSLMNQIVPADEIIIVNNNSTDKSVDIIKKYPVKLINEAKQGMTPARNRGFNAAQYDIIARTDADTIVPPDWIKKIKNNFKDKKVVAITGPSHFYEVPSYLSSKTIFNLHKPYFLLLKEIQGHECLYGPNMALRKDAWEKIKNSVCLDDHDVHEDIDLGIHVALVGEIKLDNTLIVDSSFRRFRRFVPYLEYPYRMVTSIRKHEQFTMRAQSKRIVKKIVAKTLVKADI